MLAIIGGSGLYQLDELSIEKEHVVDTPFGQPSGPVIEGSYQGQSVLFLARHGMNHQLLPGEVNYRANIFALKSLGARRVLGISAAGSLREDLKPGDLAIASQYFDHTRGKRAYSFFGEGVAAHVSTAYPVCPALSADIRGAAARIGQALHFDKTYACCRAALGYAGGKFLFTRRRKVRFSRHDQCAGSVFSTRSANGLLHYLFSYRL